MLLLVSIHHKRSNLDWDPGSHYTLHPERLRTLEGYVLQSGFMSRNHGCSRCHKSANHFQIAYCPTRMARTLLRTQTPIPMRLLPHFGLHRFPPQHVPASFQSSNLNHLFSAHRVRQTRSLQLVLAKLCSCFYLFKSKLLPQRTQPAISTQVIHENVWDRIFLLQKTSSPTLPLACCRNLINIITKLFASAIFFRFSCIIPVCISKLVAYTKTSFFGPASRQFHLYVYCSPLRHCIIWHCLLFRSGALHHFEKADSLSCVTWRQQILCVHPVTKLWQDKLAIVPFAFQERRIFA